MTYSPSLSQRMGRIAPFYVMELLAKARALEAQGRSIIHMEIGEPDFVTPAPIVRAGQQALAAGHTHYTPATGLPALRLAIAEQYRSAFGIELEPNRVILTPGASGALLLVLGVTLNPSDQVLIADPGYPCNRHFLSLLGAEPLPVPVGEATAYQLDAALVRSYWRPGVRGVILASPANPTGTLVPEPELRAIHDEVRARGGVLIVDEIYQGLVYGRTPSTALELGEDLFVINSFSKYQGMTGWRLGWIVAPKACIEPIDRLAQNVFLAPSTIAQHAALAAFAPETQEIFEQRRLAFQERRDFLLPALRELGFGLPVTPEGAFYLYADAGRLTTDSADFAERLLFEAGVAVTPGRDFGYNRPERFLRFAYTTAIDKLQEGVDRLRRFTGT